MLVQLLRFFRGTLEFQVDGKYLERFLNLAARSRIPIWDGKRESQSFSGKTLIRNEQQLKEISEKVQLQWSSSKTIGIPKIKYNYRRRIGVGIGTTIVAIFLLLSQQFVWRIEVKGNENIKETDIINTLKAGGLKPGAWKRNLDVIKIADKITLEFEEISWSAVNLRGTVAEIEIVERVKPPELVDENSPCNVISTKTGRIVGLEVYDGQRMVQIGDTVKEGGLIAAGILQDRHGRTIYRHARAKAVIEYHLHETIKTALSSKELLPIGGHKNVYYVLIGDNEFPLTLTNFCSKGDFSTNYGLVANGIYQKEDTQWFYSVRNKPLTIWNIKLPIKIRVKQFIPAVTIELKRDIQRAKDICLMKVNQLKRQLQSQEIEVVSEELVGSVQNNVFILSAKLLCHEDTAQEVEIQIEPEAKNR